MPENTNLLQQLLTLRTLVGYLGEKKQFGWWDTAFLDATGLKFLAINFPRSAFSAGLNSITEAAQNVHDKHIGKGRVFHLFRLPYVLEEELFNFLRDADSGMYGEMVSSKKEALRLLKDISNGSSGEAIGPVQIGSTLQNVKTIEEMAGYYHNAFTRDKQTFPYFVSE